MKSATSHICCTLSRSSRQLHSSPTLDGELGSFCIFSHQIPSACRLWPACPANCPPLRHSTAHAPRGHFGTNRDISCIWNFLSSRHEPSPRPPICYAAQGWLPKSDPVR